MNRSGTGVAAISSAVGIGASRLFHGLCPALICATYRRTVGPYSSTSASRVACSRTTITWVPCRFPPLGANRALSRIRCRVSSGSGSSVNSRTAGVVRMTSYRSMPRACHVRPLRAARVARMNPVIGLSLGRIAVGALALANPATAAKTFQLDPATNPQVPYVVRLFGAREVALGVATLLARGKGQRGMIALGVLVDGADAATGYLAMQDGSVSRKTAMTLIVPAVGAVGSGLLGLVKRQG